MLDLSKLQKVRPQSEGRYIARCPACAESNRDRKSDHLTIWPDGHYACAAYQGDSEHRQRINALAGVEVENRSGSYRRIAPAQVQATPPPPVVPKPNVRQVGVMKDAIENLVRTNSDAWERCRTIAKARQWRPETVRLAALDQCTGWLRFGASLLKPDPMCPDEAWCFIYIAGVKVRFLMPDGTKTFRWLKSEGLNIPSLWRHECIGRETKTVWITEGEPDAIRLMDLGIGENCGNEETVCALPSASYNLRQEELSSLRQKRVIFCPDADEAGQKAAHRLCQSLATIGVKLHIRPVT